MSLSRRHFLKSTAAVTLGFAGLSNLSGNGREVRAGALTTNGFGPMEKDPAGILDLPKGFNYKVVSRAGDLMSDGLFVPGRPDGMAAFPGPNGRTVLVRNHELDNHPPEDGPFGRDNRLLDQWDPKKLYDRGYGKTPGLGGTTSLLFNTATGALEGEKLSLVGTLRNCAGGPTPWNSWISCEETMLLREEFEGTEIDHGYNFEVPADWEAPVALPVPLKDMGRFNHEAVAVDPKSGIVYQTEDRNDSLIYRYIPKKRGMLSAGGKLQALVVSDQPSLDTRNQYRLVTVPLRTPLAVHWIDMDEIDSPKDDLRHRGFVNGAARFARGEGMWTGSDGIYFACTSGGRAQAGQIWRYVPSPAEGTPKEKDSPATLELFVEPDDKGLVDNADNLTVAPWGDLIVCEDGSGDQFLVGITPQGGIYKFAHNAFSESEFAGSTFSPDGSTLFVNIQGDGLTLAITGPWRKA